MTSKEEYILSTYEELSNIGNGKNVKLVRDTVTGMIFVKKVLDNYNIELYKKLKDTQIEGIPGIVHLIENDNKLIIIEEYINSQTLGDKYPEGISSEKAVDIILKLLKILEELHSMNPPIIHRDIKPGNIMITEDDKIVLVDFNISRYYSSNQNKDTVIMGTSGYAAPEQFGFLQTDGRSDIFSVGVLMQNIINDYTEIKKEKIEKIVKKCTEIDPNNRYKNVAELKNDLLRLSNSEEKIKVVEERREKNCYDSYALPGFRSKKIYKMILSSMGYICLISLIFQMEIDTKESAGIKTFETWGIRISLLISSFLTIFICSNYKHMGEKIPGFENGKSLFKTILGCIVWFCTFVLCAVTFISVEGLFIK